MEAISYQERIDYYLEKNMIKGTPKNDKERIKKLNDIIFNEKINLDYYELQKSKKFLTTDEYINLLERSKLNICHAVSYIAIIQATKKLERRFKRKANIQKIKSIFRKK